MTLGRAWYLHQPHDTCQSASGTASLREGPQSSDQTLGSGPSIGFAHPWGKQGCGSTPAFLFPTYIASSWHSTRNPLRICLTSG